MSRYICGIVLKIFNVVLLSQEETAKQKTTKKEDDTESVDGKDKAKYMTL
jgi:hypothetical protein